MGRGFVDVGYELVKGLLHPSNFYTYLLNVQDKGKRDTFVQGSLGFYKDPIFEMLLQHLLPIVEEKTQFRLYKTYSYARIYKVGDELKVHKDRDACEVTVSISLGSKGGIWPLYILDRDNVPNTFYLQPGDAVIFKGIELFHGRELNLAGPCAQLLLHYVDKNGPYSLNRDDQLLGIK